MDVYVLWLFSYGHIMLNKIVSPVFSGWHRLSINDNYITKPIPLICLTDEKVGSFVTVRDISFTPISSLVTQRGAVYNELKTLPEFPQVYRLSKNLLVYIESHLHDWPRDQQ